MTVRPVSIRSFLLTIALCLFGGAALTAGPTASVFHAATGGYRIAGTVTSAADGHPLARARISLKSAADTHTLRSMVTSEDGRFEFADLPAGKYSLDGAKRGFISASYDEHDQLSTEIVTGAGLDTETLVLRLAPDAVIAGKILDEAGEPVRRATVAVYFDDHSEGMDRIHQLRSVQTDYQGIYEIAPLNPGTYFVSASAKPWYAVYPGSDAEKQGAASIDRSLDVAYPVTYYPDVTDPDTAMPIPLRGGDRVQVDIHLIPVPALRLLLHVPEGGQNAMASLQQPAFDGSTSLQSSGGRLISPGVLEITGVPAGRYTIRTGGPGLAIQTNAIDIGKDGQEVDTSSAEAMSSVKVLVHVAGESALSARLTVGLRTGNRGLAVWQAVNSKGEAELQQIAAGKYEVLVGGTEKPYSIARISAEGNAVTGHTLTVAPGSLLSISLTLVGGSVEVQGAVKRAGKVVAGAMVVLVPKDPQGNHDLFRRAQSATDGTFSLRDVVPGSYTVVAIEKGWDLDWSQANVIAAYMKGGQTIEVGNQKGRAINLPEAVEARSK
jgi:hypothetical protein